MFTFFNKFKISFAVATVALLFANLQANEVGGSNEQLQEEDQASKMEQQPQIDSGLDETTAVKMSLAEEEAVQLEEDFDEENFNDSEGGRLSRGKKAAIAGGLSVTLAFIVARVLDGCFNNGDFSFKIYDKICGFFNQKPECYKEQLLRNEPIQKQKNYHVGRNEHQRVASLDERLGVYSARVILENELKRLLWRARWGSWSLRDRRFLDKFVSVYALNNYNRHIRQALDEFSRGVRGLKECFTVVWGFEIQFPSDMR